MFTYADHIKYYHHLARSERDGFRPLSLAQFRALVERIMS